LKKRRQGYRAEKRLKPVHLFQGGKSQQGGKNTQKGKRGGRNSRGKKLPRKRRAQFSTRKKKQRRKKKGGDPEPGPQDFGRGQNLKLEGGLASRSTCKGRGWKNKKVRPGAKRTTEKK